MIDRTKFIELPQKVWLVYDTHKKDKFAHIEKAFLSEQAALDYVYRFTNEVYADDYIEECEVTHD